MKKILLTLIVSFAFCGSIFAQHETHWPEFNLYDYENNDGYITFVQIDGEFVTSEDNWADLEVGAFVNGIIRGHAFMADHTEEYGDPYPLLEIYVYYDDDDTGEEVTFTLYNHSTEVEYGICIPNISIATGDDHVELYFNYDEAVILNFTSTATQTIALTQGVNWFSANVEITLDDLKAALVEALPNTTGMIIKSKTQNTRYIGNNRWVGQLNSLDVALMYKISVPDDCEITLEGMPIDPAEHPIIITEGANWIGFPFDENKTPANAFAGFATTGDVVKGKNGSTRYLGNNRWAGQLTTLVPGQGYTYISNSPDARTLVYPTAK